MSKRLTFSQYHPKNISNQNIIPIVFLHGWGLNSAIWQPLIELLQDDPASNLQIIALDLPGFGINQTTDVTPYSLDNICRHIEKTIEQPAIYLGWSLGGLIATKMSTMYPDKVLALITIASSPYFVEQASCNWPGIKEHILESFHQQLTQDTTKTINGFLKIQAMGSPHIRKDLKLITQLVMSQPLPSQKTLDYSLLLLSDCDLRKELVSIKQPFLRLYGHNDSLVPKAVIEKINNIAPKSEYYIFDRASHAPFISHLDEFYGVLLTWIKAKVN